MRFRDLSDYIRLRRFTHNPWEIVRFRNQQQVGTELPVQLRSGETLHLRGGLHDFHMFHRVFLLDEYRLGSLGRLSCVLDVGANVGVFALCAAKVADRVCGFEPVVSNFNQLKQNTADLDNVEVHRQAIAAEPGTLRLYHPWHAAQTGSYTAHTELLRYDAEEFDEAQAVTLDDVFEGHGIDVCDLMKIDVEGHEYEILHAASPETLARVGRIHGEYHNIQPHDPRTRIENFTGFLQDHGYSVDVVAHPRKENHGMFFAERSG